MNAPARRPHAAALRPPSEVMRLARMGASFPTRLSFMRSLIRRLHAEGARVARPVWEIGPEGFGHGVYTVALGGRPYSLVAVSTRLDPDARTDRVIAEAWDSAYVLYDGVPDAAEIARIAATAPRQEAARFTPRDLVLSRANKSVRLFDHVVERLAQGRQPDRETIRRIGYLMRTTAVYGNGKFGIADRDRIAGRPGLSGPFQAEMLTVWLIRGFTHDLVDHIAAQAPGAARLAPALRRHIGIGNATGLGMAPFLVNHPRLIHAWVAARETALARVRAVARAEPETAVRVRALLARARAHLDEWVVEDPRQMARIERLRAEMAALETLATDAWLAGSRPWDRLVAQSVSLSLEAQELVVALVLEPHGALIDDLAEAMAADEATPLDAAMPCARLRALIAEHYDWALATDFDDPGETHRFWYVSEEKLEPRLGLRHAEPGAERESPLDIARQVQALDRALAGAGEAPLAALLLRAPEHRAIARRVQMGAAHGYAEIRDNLIGEACLPVDILRAKLAFFGASKFDPKSDRWTRITLFQGAPTATEIGAAEADDWAFPVLGSG